MDNLSARPQPAAVDLPAVSLPAKPVRPRYTIYLLTIWFDDPENASDPACWRFRLENPRTKEGKGFVGVEKLVDGLVDVIGEGR